MRFFRFLRRWKGSATDSGLRGYDVGMPSIGPLELGIVLVIILLIFGPKRLPGLGKQLGSGMREFKESITGKGGKDEKEQPKVDAAQAAEAEPAATPAEKPQAAAAEAPRADS